MPLQNICSEVALQKILRQYGVPSSIDLILSLKKCESLEAMQPCVDSVLREYHLENKVACGLTDVSFEFLKQRAKVSNPIAIRVTNQVRGESRLHTINIVQYDRLTDTYTYDEEDSNFPNRNNFQQISADDLAQWRHGNYGFYCRLI